MNNVTRNARNRFVPQTSTANPFVKAMQVQSNFGLTENGALTNKSTLNYVLDWFGAGGALRQRDESSIIQLFSKAFAQDKLLATKILFYFRDIREGQGERRTFRICMKWLAENHPEIVRKNIEHIPFYGRWDDLYAMIGTSLESDVFALFSEQLKEDLHNMKNGESVSLLSKWIKSENTSSVESRCLGRKTREALELSPKRYRKILSALRSYIDVIEVKMCGRRWSKINFERVPSKASLNYRKAFGRHDQTRYAAYLESVKKGESKINAGAVYPYEIFRSLIKNCYGHSTPTAQEILAADLTWKAMPDWFNGNDIKMLTVSDVSGSMFSGIPNILVSVSLAIYTAERNVGPFKDFWLNFSSTPSFQRLIGNNLWEKFRNMDRENWGQSTDLQACFDLILSTAIKNKIDQKDLPQVLLVISDMEFDQACTSNTMTHFEVMKQKFANAGYALPQVIWWNVASRNDNFPIRSDETGTALVSGCSPSILKSIMSGKKFDPMSMIYDTVEVERYNRVIV